MNSFSFNVLHEPWIPVISLRGDSFETGILECLGKAHEILEIRSPAPIIEFGLYRFLVAFVLDALIMEDKWPEDFLDLKDLLQEKKFDMKMIQRYIDICGNVFDLFDPERPFLQTKMDDPKSKSIAGVFPVTPSGSNANFWHHQHESEISISAAEAARILTTIAPFMTAGGRSLRRSINGDPPLYTLPTGRNLFETTLLNIPHKKQEEDRKTIAWRNERLPGEARFQATTVEALTWRPRQIQLLPERDATSNIVVRKMKFEEGDDAKELEWFDASLAYQFENNTVKPLRMQENRPIWRDAGPLVLLHKGKHGKGEGKKYFQRPDVVEYAFEIADIQEEITINLYSMCAKNAKISEWIQSRLIIPSSLGHSSRLGSLVHQELEKTEEGAKSLQKSIKALYPREGKGNKNALGNLANRCEQGYWKKLETLFHPLMSAFAKLDPDALDDPALIMATTSEWRKSIRKFALEQFDLAAKDMDSDSDALERQVHARERLRKALNKNLKEVVE